MVKYACKAGKTAKNTKKTQKEGEKMKKLLVSLLTLCLMIGILCVPTFAADDSIVMEVSGLKKDGKTIVSLNY